MAALVLHIELQQGPQVLRPAGRSPVDPTRIELCRVELEPVEADDFLLHLVVGLAQQPPAIPVEILADEELVLDITARLFADIETAMTDRGAAKLVALPGEHEVARGGRGNVVARQRGEPARAQVQVNPGARPDEREQPGTHTPRREARPPPASPAAAGANYPDRRGGIPRSTGRAGRATAGRTGSTTARTRRSLLSGQEFMPASLLTTTCSLESRTPDQSCSRASTSVPAVDPAAKANAKAKRAILLRGSFLMRTGLPARCSRRGGHRSRTRPHGRSRVHRKRSDSLPHITAIRRRAADDETT